MFRLREGTAKDLHRYYIAFKECFDKKELLPEIVLLKGLANNKAQFLLMEDEEFKVPITFAYVVTSSESKFAYVLYCAELPWFNEPSVMNEMIRRVSKYYQDDFGGLIIPISELPSKEKANEKIDMYRMAGYELINYNSASYNDVKLKFLVIKRTLTEDPTPNMKNIIHEIYAQLLREYTIKKVLKL